MLRAAKCPAELQLRMRAARRCVLLVAAALARMVRGWRERRDSDGALCRHALCCALGAWTSADRSLLEGGAGPVEAAKVAPLSSPQRARHRPASHLPDWAASKPPVATLGLADRCLNEIADLSRASV
eukprot:jgi/Ulvmu1/2501/UM138_0005.1